ncbi:MAG: hypothetical protein KJP09_11875 [Bacteroidia bacterium]|nr:hypothetical protein [Bacteroidia bacterium]MBT8309231.1 hypothetical protein [Bacteroidia bacterium]NNL61366.1 hypothetical protein [Flavobacteriaceae bacterium]RZV70207.1 MAG: hypothetical protein EX254_00725 [Flavobacteriaceae bacterium]
MTVLLILPFIVVSQEIGSTINEKFSNYAKSPREVVYAHLNKSTYIKGESMGFSAYIIDKTLKQLSTVTSNLYCVIYDSENKVVKKKLLKVTNGIAPGEFSIDSLFNTGSYSLKVYTNYMRNFKEQNYYHQSFKVIDVEIDQKVYKESVKIKMDAQFLPEGGHLLADVQNTIGVIVKDSLGFGAPFVNGELLNANNEIISTFKTNQLGIGKFAFTPEKSKAYRTILKINNKEQQFDLPIAEQRGVAMTLNDLGSKVALTFRTNKESLESISGSVYRMIIHDGSKLKTISLSFNEAQEIVKYISYDDLSTGINIFTLFNEEEKPILERMFFKYDNLKTLSSGSVTTTQESDSLTVKVPINGIEGKDFNNFSISVLPSGTISYEHHQNIISSTFLQPYLNSPVENASYYFQNINRKKKYELDLLLLTQGWSSYDWYDVFNNPPKLLYPFETGISINATVNRRTSGQYLIYPTRFSKSNLIALTDDEKTFERTDFYFLSDERIRIGEIQSNGKVLKPSLYLQFNPSKIPDFKMPGEDILDIKGERILEYSGNNAMIPSWNNIEELDEVVVTADRKATKLERLRKTNTGNVDVFDDKKRKSYSDLASYLSTKGFQVYPNAGTLVILNKNAVSANSARTPLVYLDGVLLSSFSLLFNFQMNIVDYIVVNRSGVGEGVRGAGGVIKIYTDPSVNLIKKYGKVYQEYEVPLTYSKTKKFYTPKYSSFQSDFYKEYGVIHWVPDLRTDSMGNFLFSIPDTDQDEVKLFIEGISAKGQYLSESKNITLK